MTQYFADFDRLFTSLESGGVILTPNKRLSRFILAQYACFQSHRGLTAWPSLPCYSVNTWFMLQWEALAYTQQQLVPMLLDAAQENAIWLSIIRQQNTDVELFNPSAAAVACRRAWNTLVQWRLDPKVQEGIAPAFLSWLESYEKLCEKNALMDSAQMKNRVNKALADGQLKFPSQLILYAFDDINPQLQHLIDLAAQSQCSVTHFDPTMGNKNRWRRFIADDPDDEILCAARWAAKKIADDPASKIGVVIPKLSSMRARVEGIFTQVFEPQYISPQNPRHASAFNISAGIPLSDTPPVAAAFLALKLNLRSLDIEDLSKLLHSPFWGVQKEMPARSFFDARLRECYLSLSPVKLRTLAGEYGKPSNGEASPENGSASPLKDLHTRLHDFQQVALSAPNALPPSQWGQIFSRQLHLLGWPGERALDTLEFQQVEAWVECLAGLSRYDYVFSKVTLNDAIELLTRVCFEKQFQAQTSTSPVQVLGLFEAAGLVFDHLWVMQLDDESWPAPTSPNPLLPKGMQKDYQMPLSSPEKELALAEKLTARFKQSATAVVFSCAAREGDKEFQHSALIDHIPAVAKTSLALVEVSDLLGCVGATSELEQLYDSQATVLSDSDTVQGGTQIIKDQAACPFRAFATHRLGARKQEQALPGLGASERGMLIHDTLEFVWKTLADHGSLLAIDESGLDELIFRGSEHSFKNRQSLFAIGERLKNIEQARIHRLVRAWLEVEKERAPFTVYFSEVNRHLSLGGLPIHIRYDRIDKLEDGSLFVIDYKTGRSAIKDWDGLRPNEPQVPIYGIANADEISAVAFGQINVEGIVFKGISEREEIAPGLKLPEDLETLDLPGSWQDILIHWRKVLEDLAAEFIRGEAAVRPKQGATTCRYCALHSLCRIKETFPDEDFGNCETGQDDLDPNECAGAIQ